MLVTRNYIYQMGYSYSKMNNEQKLEMIFNEKGIHLLYKYFITKDKRFLAFANLTFKKSKVKSDFLKFLTNKLSQNF